MKVAALLAMLVVPGVAAAEVDARFGKLMSGAEKLGALGSFLESYVGDCPSELNGGGECRKHAAAFRQKSSGKRLYMIISEDAASMISMGSPGRGGDFTLNVTPFFPAAGMALTEGAPRKTDAHGNPVMSYLTVKGNAPDDVGASALQRQVGMRALRLQVVFTPLGVWELPKKGGGKMTGVKARIDGLQVTVGKTGESRGVYLAR